MKDLTFRQKVIQGIHDLFYIWKREFGTTFRDQGVLIFFVLVPLVYPLIYAFIYTNETIHEVPTVVVDDSRSSLSREYLRKVDSSPEVSLVSYCADMEEAKLMLKDRRAYGIIYIPSTFSDDIVRGKQTQVSIFCDMSGLLYYKALLTANTNVSLAMNADIKVERSANTTDRQDEITAYQNTVLGAEPQDFNYRGDASQLIIGDENIIRENVVINRATFSDGQTVIGDRNFLMEGVHISHDTKVGQMNVFGYGTKIAGDCIIGDRIIFSSGVIANPGARVGDAAMIQSGTRFSKDVPPFIVATDNPVRYGGVNSTVLRNYGVDEKVIAHIANAYLLVFHGQTSVFDAVNQVVDQVPDGPEIQNIVKFIRETKLGIISKL